MKTKLISFTILFSFVCFIVYGQTSIPDSSTKLKRLESAVYVLVKKNKDLEARIAKLESTPATSKEKQVVQQVYSSTDVHDLSRELDDIKSDLKSLSYDVDDFSDFLGIGWSSAGSVIGNNVNTLEDIQRALRDKADSFHFH